MQSFLPLYPSRKDILWVCLSLYACLALLSGHRIRHLLTLDVQSVRITAFSFAILLAFLPNSWWNFFSIVLYGVWSLESRVWSMNMWRDRKMTQRHLKRHVLFILRKLFWAFFLPPNGPNRTIIAFSFLFFSIFFFDFFFSSFDPQLQPYFE